MFSVHYTYQSFAAWRGEGQNFKKGGTLTLQQDQGESCNKTPESLPGTIRWYQDVFKGDKRIVDKNGHVEFMALVRHYPGIKKLNRSAAQ